MQVVELEAARFATVLDFCEGLRRAIGAPDWHGSSIGAFIDSMIWGGINALEPPYTIRVRVAWYTPKAVRDEIELLKRCLAEARYEHQLRKRGDVEVVLEIAS